MMNGLCGKIGRGVSEAPLELARLARGGYPSFVWSSNRDPLGQDVPVFMFHDVSLPRFESQLAYLKANDYKTLTMFDFMAFLKGDFRVQGPSVLLTFDDGHKSWHQTAFPLLQKYGFHAVGFLVSSFIRETPEPNSPWLSWPEVREIAESGFMSFESHTSFHDRVFIGRSVVDFFRPGLFLNTLGLDVPWVHTDEGYTNRLPLGAPIHAYAPRLAGMPRFCDDPAIRTSCARFVERHGAESFFKQSGWRRKLMEIWRSESGGRDCGSARFETPEEQRAEILNDLAQSRSVINERLQRETRHLCYPWGIGDELAVDVSREVGYESNCRVAGPRSGNIPGDSPWEVPRIKDDYIFRLPGKGRMSLAEIVLYKLHRRAEKENIY